VHGHPDSVNQDDTDDNDSLASRLTEAQKERLVTALLGTQSITKGDLKLIELVKTWKDPRLLDFLLAKLHDIEGNPTSVADELVDDLSDVIDDKETSDLAEEFRNAPSAQDASQENNEDQREEGGAKDAEQAAKQREAIQQRGAALKKLLAAVESRLDRQTVKLP
jgi:hypothetical protein